MAAAGGAGESVYVEDVFSTFLYEGNSSTNVITNGIDLAGEGGLVWGKSRDNAFSHMLIDTVRGGDKGLSTNATSAEYDNNTMITSFNSNGFTLGSYLGLNYNGDNVASWTFRKQAGFFDVVTYTGNGSNRTISHNLGSVPGVMIVKRTSASEGWQVYHRDLAATEYLELNSTNAKSSSNGTLRWNSTRPTATEFSLGTHDSVNANGSTYVAYLFAHDDQSFGDDSDEAIIKCGSYTGNGNVAGPLVDVGFEPQFVLIKAASRTGHWFLLDVMRGIITGTSDSSPGSNQYLLANSSGAEGTTTSINVNSTGFQPRTSDDAVNENSATYIYVAIRRPMKTPEAGTEVFTVARGDSSGDPEFISGFPVDFAFYKDVDHTANWDVGARIIAKTTMHFNATTAETGFTPFMFDYQNGVIDGAFSSDFYAWNFKRATGFFDVVAYTGNGSSSGRNIIHNLKAVPELMIVKCRSASDAWMVYSSAIGNTKYLTLNSSAAEATSSLRWNNTTPTDSVFTVGGSGTVNSNGETYIAYLFASLDGVSKVGSYTGTGSNINVDCGFSAGARFVLIKRTDSTQNWFLYDSVRGIVASADPSINLNTSSAQSAVNDDIDPLSSGFSIPSGSNVNTNNGTYIFLAIA